jgi:DNA-binding IclR family transcriptional regulator
VRDGSNARPVPMWRRKETARAQGAVELARVMRLPAQWTIRLLHQLRAEGAVTRGPGGWRLAQ